MGRALRPILRLAAAVVPAAAMGLAGAEAGTGRGPVSPLGVGGPLFLVDDARVPHVKVWWPTASGRVMTLEGDRAYADPGRRESLGHNLECYVAPGGTRLDVGAADPTGAVIRVGFYKIDGRRPLFEDMANDSPVTIVLSNVAFNQPASPRRASAIHHAKFDDPGSMLGCNASAGLAARNALLDLYNTADPKETLGGRITARNGRPGSLAGHGPAPAGSVVLRTEADGTVTMIATIPYALFKHPDDPWLRNNPGDFTEPFHFHVEFEVVPAREGGPGEAAQRPVAGGGA